VAVRRGLAVCYGVAVYAGFLGVFAVMVDFLANAGHVRGIDDGMVSGRGAALAIDLGLLALFGVSHSVLARASVKRRWTQVVPTVVERSTFVLIANLTLAVLVWRWRALPDVVWHVDHEAAHAVVWVGFGAGIVLIVVSTFLTDHFDLFGLRQVWLYARRQPYTPVPFQVRGLYRWVRHPMMLGVLVWIWATPTMTVGHLVFSLGMTAYIAVGVALEERSLARELGAPYLEYRRKTRAILPLPRQAG